MTFICLRNRLADKVYVLADEVLKKLASVVVSHRKFFAADLAELTHGLSSSAVSELVTLCYGSEEHESCDKNGE